MKSTEALQRCWPTRTRYLLLVLLQQLNSALLYPPRNGPLPLGPMDNVVVFYQPIFNADEASGVVLAAGSRWCLKKCRRS